MNNGLATILICFGTCQGCGEHRDNTEWQAQPCIFTLSLMLPILPTRMCSLQSLSQKTSLSFSLAQTSTPLTVMIPVILQNLWSPFLPSKHHPLPNSFPQQPDPKPSAETCDALLSLGA